MAPSLRPFDRGDWRTQECCALSASGKNFFSTAALKTRTAVDLVRFDQASMANAYERLTDGLVVVSGVVSWLGNTD